MKKSNALNVADNAASLITKYLKEDKIYQLFIFWAADRLSVVDFCCSLIKYQQSGVLPQDGQATLFHILSSATPTNATTFYPCRMIKKNIKELTKF